MLNIFAKCLLVTTSLSPLLVAVAISQFEPGESLKSWTWWLAVLVGFLLATLCKLLLRYAEKSAQTQSLVVREFERRDQEVLTFLFIYLLPFIRCAEPGLANDWLTSAYVLAVIVIAIACADGFHFNPIMRLLFRYRFYSVKDCHGVPNLLISNRDLRRPQEVRTVRLAWNVYLCVGDLDA